MNTTIASPSPATQQWADEPFKIRTIVAGLEFTETSLHAFEFTLALSQRFDAAVHVAHVFGGEDEFQPAAGALEYLARREATTRLQAEAERRGAGNFPIEQCHLRIGKPAKEICALAREIDADLVAVATEGRTGFKHLTLGSTAEAVVRHAPSPVLVVRKRTRPWRIEPPQGLVFEKILVPMDFSDCAEAGARYAAHFASHVGADLLLVHVINPADYMPVEGAMYAMPSPDFIGQRKRDAEDGIEMIANQLPFVGISADTRVLVGDPRVVLEDLTRDSTVDMVITSTHGRTGLAHAFLGSTAEYLVRMADCPVLVVPSHPR